GAIGSAAGCARLHAPQPESPTTKRSAAPSQRQRPAARFCTAANTARLTKIITAEMPYTPVTSAHWIRVTKLCWEYPRLAHGKQMKKNERSHSSPTQTRSHRSTNEPRLC